MQGNYFKGISYTNLSCKYTCVVAQRSPFLQSYYYITVQTAVNYVDIYNVDDNCICKL